MRDLVRRHDWVVASLIISTNSGLSATAGSPEFIPQAATLRFALSRAGKGSLDSADRELVENALERLSQNLNLPQGLLSTQPTQETSGPE